MALMPRPVRALSLVTVALFLWLLFQISKSDIPRARPPPAPPAGSGGGASSKNAKLTDWVMDPNLDITGEPPGPLRRVEGNNYAPNNPHSARVNATLLALVRNSELKGMLQSMRDLERTWNHKFNYPWLFLNDEPFTDEFIEKTSAATNAEVRYELVPKEHWEMPSWINPDLYKESVELLTSQGVQYMDRLSYHQMCRWNSGFFYRHPALRNIRYYWRVEPAVRFFCDVDYDVFAWMQDHNQTYGFTVNLYDSPESVAGLWPETERFLATHQEYLHPNNAMRWLTDRERRPGHWETAHGYSTCHYWSNFEIGDMDFWRGEAYGAFFEHLDRAGGFWYERWGDAPVHSIALGLFEDRNKIHWFRDIGYQHAPYFNCPNSPKCRGCEPGKFTDGEDFLHLEDCRPLYFAEVGMH